MGFVRGLAGVVIASTLLALVGHAASLLEYAAVAVGIQWAAALFYAIPRKDERIFDLTGAVTHATLVRLAYRVAVEDKPDLGWRAQGLTVLVCVWCARLGLFLYWRILSRGEDTRFAEIRTDKLRFLSVWTIQGLWVFLTDLPVLLSVVHGQHSAEIHPLDVAGAALWAVGFALEALADWQKTQFRQDPKNKGKFICSGLWAYSRHPNYLGEILLWIGVFLVSVHTLQGQQTYQLLAAISPVFVALLLLFVSGIPLLEKQGDERWGKDEAYQQYKRQTSVLLLLPKRSVPKPKVQ
jgi:steroid 5-alpha reductase family enzyme